MQLLNIGLSQVNLMLIAMLGSLSLTFLTGFVENNQYLGRPVDVMQMKDGSLLVSDENNGAVYRISYGNAKTASR